MRMAANGREPRLWQGVMSPPVRSAVETGSPETSGTDDPGGQPGCSRFSGWKKGDAGPDDQGAVTRGVKLGTGVVRHGIVRGSTIPECFRCAFAAFSLHQIDKLYRSRKGCSGPPV